MPYLDHVALVVHDLETMCARCVAFGLEAGTIEDFPGEGTREVYLGPTGASARLLLIQPTGLHSPYARALSKRGPGLHHIAVALPTLTATSLMAAAPGWLLHPASLEAIPHTGTAWLARPGVGALLEVQEGSLSSSAPVVEQVAVPVQPGLESLLTLRVDDQPVTGLVAGDASLSWGDQVVAVAELVGA